MAKEAAWKTMHDVALILFAEGLIPNPNMVKQAVITVSQDDATTVDVTMFVEPDAVNKAVTEIVTRYQLIPVEPKEVNDNAETDRSQ